MFDTVVIGVDGARSQDAIRLARALAPSASVTLVNAYPHDRRRSRAVSPAFEAALHDDAVRLLRVARDAAGIEATLRAVPDPSPARALHRVASELGADLLVIGPATFGLVEGVLRGDVGRGVLHSAPCPVAVAAHAREDEKLRTIAVAFDDSPEAHEALSAAAALAAEHEAALRLVTVVHPITHIIAPMYPYAYQGADWQAHAGQALLDAQHAAARVAAALDVPAEPVVLPGVPSEELARISERADLMVTDSRGWGPVRQVVLGSTSYRLLHRAMCPVLVVPRPVTEDDPAEPAPEERVALTQ